MIKRALLFSLMENIENYNPLEKKHIGESVVRAMFDQPVTPLGAIEPFLGVGIYAIYYTGKFPPYITLSQSNENGKFGQPIYVGKAVPSGARKGLNIQIDHELFKRIREHAESIKQSSNLDITDFYCRHLNVDDIWIPLGETLLIEMFRPLWNVVVDGFGNHDPGSGRYNQMKSRWDVLHPGRTWAEKCSPYTGSIDDLLVTIRDYLEVK